MTAVRLRSGKGGLSLCCMGSETITIESHDRTVSTNGSLHVYKPDSPQ